jgi:hypothetical protein
MKRTLVVTTDGQTQTVCRVLRSMPEAIVRDTRTVKLGPGRFGSVLYLDVEPHHEVPLVELSAMDGVEFARVVVP